VGDKDGQAVIWAPLGLCEHSSTVSSPTHGGADWRNAMTQTHVITVGQVGQSRKARVSDPVVVSFRRHSESHVVEQDISVISEQQTAFVVSSNV
jgi:hypothetical protein